MPQTYRVTATNSPTATAVLGPLRAVPGAEGYKADTISGGRLVGAGQVIKVTNLNSSGAGSFNAALAVAGRKHIIFEVGGCIQLEDYVNIYGDNISIWFQTAPPPGITLIRGSDNALNPVVNVLGTNIVISHMRLRDRNDLSNSNNQGMLATGLQDPDNGFPDSGSHQVFYDHLSTAWTGDEHCFISDDSTDITFWRSNIGPTAYAGRASLIGANPSGITNVARLLYNQCFWPLDYDRTPLAKLNTKWAMYNNYFYACGHGGGSGCSQALSGYIQGVGTISQACWSMRGNVYEANGSHNYPQFEWDQSCGDANPNHQAYWNDNPGCLQCIEDPEAVVDNVANESDLNMGLPEVANVLNSSLTKSTVLAHSGARPLDRDSVDSGAVTNATNGTGTQLTAAPPSLYTLSSTSRSLSVPANWSDQAPGEASGYTVFDTWMKTYTDAVGS